MLNASTDNGHVSVDEALKVIAAGDYDPRSYRIQAIKDMRAMTGLGLRESKDVIDEAFSRDEEVSLGSVLDELHRKEINDPYNVWSIDPDDAAVVRVDDRERKRERDRAYRRRAIHMILGGFSDAAGDMNTKVIRIRDLDAVGPLLLVARRKDCPRSRFPLKRCAAP